MNENNWEIIKGRLELLASLKPPAGARRPFLEIQPPVSIDDVNAWEETYRVALPASLARFFTDCTGGIEIGWFWNVDVRVAGDASFRMGYFRMNLEFCHPWSWEDFGPAHDWSPEEKLERWGPADQKLSFMSEDGDDFAMSLNEEDQRGVVFLGHESEGNVVKLGRDFPDFLDRFTQIGCIDQHWDYVNYVGADGIDMNSPTVIAVKEWLRVHAGLNS